MQTSKSFSNPHHFAKEADGWRCTVCHDKHHMNLHNALRHERESGQHARNVQESEMWWASTTSPDVAAWDAPLVQDPPLTKDELQVREHQYHVERVADIVPYWLKCVEAAAKGEELRLEPFLDTLRDSWMPSDDPWAHTGSGWGDCVEDAGRWGVSSSLGSKTRTGSRTGAAGSVHDTAYAFVEDVARKEAVTDTDRKRRMHNFFEMPTDEKLKKIHEMVQYLHSTPI